MVSVQQWCKTRRRQGEDKVRRHVTDGAWLLMLVIGHDHNAGITCKPIYKSSCGLCVLTKVRSRGNVWPAMQMLNNTVAATTFACRRESVRRRIRLQAGLLSLNHHHHSTIVSAVLKKSSIA